MLSERYFRLLVSVLLQLAVTIQPANGQQRDRVHCNTEVTEMNIVRHMSVNYNGAERTVDCVARVNVTECEGSCLSRVSPSVHRFPGFDQECRCCREGALTSRVITLQECFDGNELLPNLRPTTWIKQPIQCSCQLCRN